MPRSTERLIPAALPSHDTKTVPSVDAAGGPGFVGRGLDRADGGPRHALVGRRHHPDVPGRADVQVFLTDGVHRSAAVDRHRGIADELAGGVGDRDIAAPGHAAVGGERERAHARRALVHPAREREPAGARCQRDLALLAVAVSSLKRTFGLNTTAAGIGVPPEPPAPAPPLPPRPAAPAAPPGRRGRNRPQRPLAPPPASLRRPRRAGGARGARSTCRATAVTGAPLAGSTRRATPVPAAPVMPAVPSGPAPPSPLAPAPLAPAPGRLPCRRPGDTPARRPESSGRCHAPVPRQDDAAAMASSRVLSTSSLFIVRVMP